MWGSTGESGGKVGKNGLVGVSELGQGSSLIDSVVVLGSEIVDGVGLGP